MNTSSIYDTLLQLPLFLGINQRDMEEIVGYVKFDFQKRSAGKTIYAANDTNQQILFLLRGQIVCTRPDGRFGLIFEENLESPSIIGAEVLYGLTHYFSHNFRTATDVQYVTIGKDDINKHLLHYEVFRLNLLNYLSLIAQRRSLMLWEVLPEDLTQRFVQYLRHNFRTLSGYKVVRGREVDLAAALLTTKRNVSHLLQQLEERGLVQSLRGRIIIPAFERLVQDI